MNRSARRTTGYTLYELMIGLGLLVAIGTAAGGIAHQAVRDQAQSDGYTQDVEHVRRALRAIETDGRNASSAQMTDTSLELVIGNETIRYRLNDDVLERISDTATQTVARRIAAFGANTTDGVCSVDLQLARRSDQSAQAASVTTSFRPRNAGGSR